MPASSSTLDSLGLLDELITCFDRALKLVPPRLSAVLDGSDGGRLCLGAQSCELALDLIGVVFGGANVADRLVDLVNGLLELLNEFVQGCHVILPAGLF
jgi:hypothetical protein